MTKAKETQLNKNQQAVAKACDKCEVRPVLTGAVLGKGKIAAADGYILVGHPVRTRMKQAVIPAKAILELKAPITILKLKGEKGKRVARFKLTDAHGSARLIEAIDGTFPNIETLYPKTEPKAYIALSPKLLKKLLNCIGDANKICFAIREPTEPVEFKAEETGGLIMPMYINWKEVKWHKK